MLTVEKLNEIRERVRQHLNVRNNDGEVKVIISSGTTAIASGSRMLMRAALDEIERLNASDIQVQQKDLDVDSAEQPAVLIIVGEEETLMKRVSEEEIRQI